tara:strand:- start:308 stop:976 length:669 start_codon:yes stop_codon:yes gene_type:complete
MPTFVEPPESSGGTTYTAGDGLDLSGTEFTTDLKSNGGLVVESTELAVDLGASSITGTLAVGDGGTGATSLTSNGILTGNGTSAVQSETTLTYNSGTLTFAGTTGNNNIALTDNLADALSIKQGSNTYIKIVTTDDSEEVALGNTGLVGTTISIGTEDQDKYIYIGTGSNTNSVTVYIGSGDNGDTYLDSQNIYMSNLPTSDPGVSGQLWNQDGYLSVSAGE